MPESLMTCVSPLMTVVRIPLIRRFPFARTESTRALIFARIDPFLDVVPSPLNVFPVPTFNPTSVDDADPVCALAAREISLSLDVEVFASFDALEVSMTSTVTASPTLFAF
jgi:hypothetical protein